MLGQASMYYYSLVRSAIEMDWEFVYRTDQETYSGRQFNLRPWICYVLERMVCNCYNPTTGVAYYLEQLWAVTGVYDASTSLFLASVYPKREICHAEAPEALSY
jgi:hypothetical protein